MGFEPLKLVFHFDQRLNYIKQNVQENWTF